MYNYKIETIQELAKKQQISNEEKLKESQDLIKSQTTQIFKIEDKVQIIHKCLDLKINSIFKLNFIVYFTISIKSF